MQVCDLIHEYSHVCGTLDVLGGNPTGMNDTPTDFLLTGWQDLARTYWYWAAYGFCIPGYNCPSSVILDVLEDEENE